MSSCAAALPPAIGGGRQPSVGGSRRAKEQRASALRLLTQTFAGQDDSPLLDFMIREGEAPPVAGRRVLARHPFDEKKRVYVTPKAAVPLLKVRRVAPSCVCAWRVCGRGCCFCPCGGPSRVRWAGRPFLVVGGQLVFEKGAVIGKIAQLEDVRNYLLNQISTIRHALMHAFHIPCQTHTHTSESGRQLWCGTPGRGSTKSNVRREANARHRATDRVLIPACIVGCPHHCCPAGLTTCGHSTLPRACAMPATALLQGLLLRAVRCLSVTLWRSLMRRWPTIDGRVCASCVGRRVVVYRYKVSVSPELYTFLHDLWNREVPIAELK